jgi:hypothetical protein
MKNLFENFKYFLTEQKAVYEAELLVKAESATKLYGRVFEAIRGIEGITVIRAAEGIQRDPNNNKLMKLYVRFYVEPGKALTYLQQVGQKIGTMKDADGDRIISTRITKLPQVDDTFT